MVGWVSSTREGGKPFATVERWVGVIPISRPRGRTTTTFRHSFPIQEDTYVNTTRRGRSALALVAASALVFAACGSDNDSGDTGGDTGGETSEAPAGTDADRPPVPGANYAWFLLILINLFNYLDRNILNAVEPQPDPRRTAILSRSGFWGGVDRLAGGGARRHDHQRRRPRDHRQRRRPGERSCGWFCRADV